MKTNNKRCPRCGMKQPQMVVTCPKCRLNFTKFDAATNYEAKQALRVGEKEQVIFRTGFPVDVKKWKLLLFTIFLGFTGAHYYYVGRTKMGIFFSIFFGVGIINAVVSSIYPSVTQTNAFQWFYLLVLVWGAVIALWIIDIAKVSLNRFKIPVSRGIE